MAPHDLRRPFKRPAISDQQRRRELSLQRQAQNRRDAQQHARCLASTLIYLHSPHPESTSEPQVEVEVEVETEPEPEASASEIDIRQASKLKGSQARKWFARQLMLPEWMIDVPDQLAQDWYVFARPAGKRCFVVSTNGTTVSRLRNGSRLHHFPSALPNGARNRDASGSAQSYSILDCIFHESDQTYYVVDMVCWRGYSLYECTAEFRHAHYQTGNTPLALVWKDENCSQYVIDTDSKGQIPSQQLVVLELQDNGSLTTSDDPPVVFGCLDGGFMQKSGLCSGNLLRFAIGNGGLSFADGKLEKADLHYLGKSNRARAFADSYSKVMFQYMARHSPIRYDDLIGSISSSIDQENKPSNVQMDG
ncbi:hypothetical protein F2P56_003303 [Juglans regia]|uniref:Snurportin-1 n=1 Tax=Juglans regia TaxID=51240 RepID=A0A834D0B1_JUGRE|nr:hypothetical protein F2P56_003303 [Juglans regia]